MPLVTAGSTSYSTSMSSMAASAISRVSAATSATGSPTYSTVSPRMGFIGGQPMSQLWSMSLYVSTAATPLSAFARSTLMLFILACACGLRFERPMSICGSVKSSRKVHLPVTISRASLRGTFTRPT